jgi:hypothetical protein
MGKNIDVRKKGHDFERKIVAEFRSKGWIRACRNIETNPDATLGIDLLHTEPFAIQCKRRRDYVSVSTIGEIPPTSPPSIPVVITKPDEGIAMVIIPLHHFLSLISPTSPSPPVRDDF